MFSLGALTEDTRRTPRWVSIYLFHILGLIENLSEFPIRLRVTVTFALSVRKLGTPMLQVDCLGGIEKLIPFRPLVLVSIMPDQYVEVTNCFCTLRLI